MMGLLSPASPQPVTYFPCLIEFHSFALGHKNIRYFCIKAVSIDATGLAVDCGGQLATMGSCSDPQLLVGAPKITGKSSTSTVVANLFRFVSQKKRGFLASFGICGGQFSVALYGQSQRPFGWNSCAWPSI